MRMARMWSRSPASRSRGRRSSRCSPSTRTSSRCRPRSACSGSATRRTAAPSRTRRPSSTRSPTPRRLREATFALWGGSTSRPMLHIGGVDARARRRPFGGCRSCRAAAGGASSCSASPSRRADRVLAGGAVPRRRRLGHRVPHGAARAAAALTAALGVRPDCAERGAPPEIALTLRGAGGATFEVVLGAEVYVRRENRVRVRAAAARQRAARRRRARRAQPRGARPRRLRRPPALQRRDRRARRARATRDAGRERRRRRWRPPAADVPVGAGPEAAYAAYAAADQAAAAFGAAGGEPVFVLGTVLLRKYYVAFDRRRGRVGFARAAAAEPPASAEPSGASAPPASATTASHLEQVLQHMGSALARRRGRRLS